MLFSKQTIILHVVHDRVGSGAAIYTWKVCFVMQSILSRQDTSEAVDIGADGMVASHHTG